MFVHHFLPMADGHVVMEDCGGGLGPIFIGGLWVSVSSIKF